MTDRLRTFSRRSSPLSLPALFFLAQFELAQRRFAFAAFDDFVLINAGIVKALALSRDILP
jgi:hypothetical protein